MAACNNKLRRYSFQNPKKSLSELLTKAKFFADMKIYVNEVENPGEHLINAFHRTPRRFGKNGDWNRRGLSNNNNNKTGFRCGDVCPHKVKCPTDFKICS